MPITKTVTGLIYSDSFNSQDGWTFVGDFSVDYETFLEGMGSFLNRFGAGPTAYAWKNIYVGPSGTKKVRFWHKSDLGGYTSGTIHLLYSSGAFDFSEAWVTEDWHYHKYDLTSTGPLLVICSIGSCAGTGLAKSWMDYLVICKSATLTVNTLFVGQKVKLYDASDDSLLDTQTVLPGQSQVTFDLSAYEWPLLAYLKIYAIDGATLIDTTATYGMYGGDTWSWSCVGGTLKLETDEVVIYRQAATGTPKTATTTATLKDTAGNPYPNKTIYFETTLGTLSAASDTTDANGEASVTLTATTHGIAVIEAKWFGDVTVPAAAGYVTVHVFYEEETGDPDEPFQFFCQGIDYPFIQGTGRYAINEEGIGELWELSLAEWPDTLTINGIVDIYRKGVLEYSGLFTEYKRSLSDPKVDIGGCDISGLLDNQLVTLVSYTSKTPQYMIADLLDGYPSGIVAGVLDSSTVELTKDFDNEYLREAIERIVEDVGWKFRINIDRTLDFAETFTGGQTAVTFTEGDNLLDLSPDVNYRRAFNLVRARGDGVTSLKQDGTKIKEQGLRMAPIFHKSISDQATLDAVCQAYLDMKKTGEEQLTAIVKDTYDVGTFGCEDQVYIDCPTLAIQGWRTIKKIERVMSDANIAVLELTNRSKDYWGLDKEYRRMTKDASV